MKGPKFSYTSAMDEGIQLKEKKAKESFNFFPLRPSSASACGRKMAHDLMGYYGKAPWPQEEKKPNIQRLLNLGHYIEEQVIDEMKLIPGLRVRFNQQVVDFFKLPISGRMIEGSTDFVLWSDDCKGLGDAKSVGDKFHSSYGTKWRGMLMDYRKMEHIKEFAENAFWVEDLEAFLKELGPEDSLYDNLIQVNGYCMTPFMIDKGIDHGFILRYCKNNSTLMEIRFNPSQAVFDSVCEKFLRVEEAVSRDSPMDVKKDFVLGSVKCAYCPYKASCWPSASKRDFYGNLPPKVWATRTNELERGKELEDLLMERDILEQNTKQLKKLDDEIILLMEGHSVQKVKLTDGTVYETKVLAKGVEVRKGKE